jgi:TatD DNase family protein
MFVDTHAHLTDDSISDRLEEIFQACREHRVETILCVGITATTSQGAVQLSEVHRTSNPAIFASVGIHPNYVHLAKATDWETILRLSKHPNVVALGESGLDRYWDDSPWDEQVEYLKKHFQLSNETGLPVILHSRDCENEMLQELSNIQQELGTSLNGVMHSFTGSKETAKKCLELGLYISFAGMLTYKKSSDLREVAKEIPKDRLLIETDSPYLSPEPHRSARPNHPAMVIHTAACLAKARDVDLSILASQTTANAHRLFNRMAADFDC